MTLKALRWKIGSMLCRFLGHRFNFVEKTMMDIKDMAENRESFLEDYICCKSCGAEFGLPLDKKSKDESKVVSGIKIKINI